MIKRNILIGASIGVFALVMCKNSFQPFQDSTKCCSLPLCETEECQPIIKLHEAGKLLLSYTKEDKVSILRDLDSLLQKYNQELKKRDISTLILDKNEILKTLEIDTCICEGNLFNLYNPAFIGHETGLAQSGDGSSGTEGPKWSVNHIVDLDNSNPPKEALELIPKLHKKSIYNSDGFDTIRVAIIDTGIKTGQIPVPHQIEVSNYISFPNSSTGYGVNVINNTTNIEDDNGHGALVTHTFHFALDRFLPSNTQFNLKVIPIKVLNDCGRGTVFDVSCGLYCADLLEADIVNMSLGMYKDEVQLERAVSVVTFNSRMTISTSAGNRNKNLNIVAHFPSDYSRPFNSPTGIDMTHVPKNVVEVGALCTNISEMCDINSTTLWTGSNYGNGMIAAPGFGFKGLLNTTMFDHCVNPGTSFSAPLVTAGLVKLKLLTTNPGTNLKNELINNSVQHNHPLNPSLIYQTFAFDLCTS